jgi:transcriptional regulator with XRE-family HTH domain
MLDPDQQRLKKLGVELFGDEFHGKLARLSGVSRSYISQIVRGDKGVSDAVKGAIADGIRREIKRLRAALNDYENRTHDR